MSHKRGKTFQMESVRLKIDEHMTSVGEELLCVLPKETRVGAGVRSVKLNVRVFVLERLSAVAEWTCNLFQGEMERLERLLERQDKLLDVMLQPRIKLHRAEVSSEHETTPSLVQEEPQPPQLKQEEEAASGCNTLSDLQLHPDVCKEEASPEHQERISGLVQVKLELLPIKEECEETLLRPEEAAGSSLTILAVKSEADDEDRKTEPLASTSTEHMKGQDDVDNCGMSQPTSTEQLLSSHGSESDTDDSDEYGLNTLKSLKTKHVVEQRVAFSNKRSQNLKSSKQTASTRSQTGKKSVSCTVCGKVCIRESYLKSHMRIHTGEKPFACSVCNKGFNHNHLLKKHTRIHTREKPFACSVCEKSFSQDAGLKKHMRIHTGEKPFACRVCNKTFKQNVHLKHHMRIHTGEKPYSCTVCYTSFSVSQNLKQHMSIHEGEKPFSCTECDKGFSRKEHLEKHVRIHSGERPFSCTVCYKSFGQSHILKAHMRIHTGERPYACTECDKSFNQKHVLKKHMRKHAG